MSRDTLATNSFEGIEIDGTVDYFIHLRQMSRDTLTTNSFERIEIDGTVDYFIHLRLGHHQVKTGLAFKLTFSNFEALHTCSVVLEILQMSFILLQIVQNATKCV